MVATIDRSLPVIFLDTGKLFPETQAYRDELTALLGLKDVRVVRPDPAQLARVDKDGSLWRHAPDHCCHLRKTLPLEAALTGFSAWITGRKRFHGDVRSTLPVIEGDSATGRIKLNPVAPWSIEDLDHYRRFRNLPVHPLVAQGYRSVGCTTCTRPVGPGDGPRAGRWWGIDKTECGIHRPGT
jgi:phosphoadenosine phosphosulfate reductase